MFTIPQTSEIPWGPIQQGLRIQIWTNQQEYAWGENIWLHLAIENCGETPLYIRSTSTFQNATHRAPLYALSFVRVCNQWQGHEHIWDLYPVASNMYHLSELTKLAPEQSLEEKSLLNSGLWSRDQKSTTVPPLSVGHCLLQAMYEVLPDQDPLLRSKRALLQQLEAPLWQGQTFSNQWAVSIQPASR